MDDLSRRGGSRAGPVPTHACAARLRRRPFVSHGEGVPAGRPRRERQAPAVLGRLDQTLLRYELLRQFVRYVLVGAGNTALSFLVYRLLLVAGTPYVVAAPVAFVAGAVNGYWINRRWTYAASDSARSRILYLLFAAAGAGVTSALVLAVVRAAAVGRGEAYLVAVPPVTVATFLANRLWTFPERR